MTEADQTPSLKWTSGLATGDGQLDADHQHLFAILDNLHDLIVRGEATNSVISDILSELAEYVYEHFTHEERMMARTHFPARQRHESEHARLTQSLSEIIYHFERGATEISGEVLAFLRNWLQSHTTSLDMDLARYLRAVSSGSCGVDENARA